MQTKTAAIILFSLTLSACASNKAPENPTNTAAGNQASNQASAPTHSPAKLDVLYTTGLPDGSYLKEKPTEITIVKRHATAKAAGIQVGLNALIFALGGGGFTAQGFSKDDLKGEKIENVNDRQNLANPIPTEFVLALQERVNAAIQADPVLEKQARKEELLVQGGSSSLVYESLLGNDEERFRLKTELYVSAKRKEFHFFPSLPRVVTCTEESSDPLPQGQWAKNNYALVKTTLDATLQACEKKVVAQLPALLKD